VVIAAAAIGAGWTAGRLADGALHADLEVEVLGLSELSGLAWLEAGRVLVGVGDGGEIAEIGLDGRTSAHVRTGEDLEDVALAAPGELLVLEEKGSRLERRSWPGGELVESRTLARFGHASANRGFEGLGAGDGALWVASEEHPAAFRRVDAPPEEAAIRVTGATSLSAILVGPGGEELLLLSRERGLLLVTSEGEAFGPWRPVVGSNLEAAAFAEGFGLVLGSDEVRSRLHLFRRYPGWADLRGAMQDAR
jgi:uncharacterized protein YjiK